MEVGLGNRAFKSFNIDWPKRRTWLAHLLFVWFSLFGILVGPLLNIAQAQGTSFVVTGTVYYDLNSNGQRDPGEPLAPSAAVSGGVRMPEAGSRTMATTTDSSGRFILDLTSVIGTGVPNGTVTSTVKNAAGPIVASGMSSFPIGPGQRVIDIALELTGEAHPGCVVCDYFPQTQYEVVFRQYFDRRGGVSTFGYPISRLFLFQGFPTQIFQRAVLQQWPDGSIHLLNLLDPGIMAFTSFNGAVVPAFDPTVVAQAPTPGSTDYGSRILDFVAATAPDLFDGR